MMKWLEQFLQSAGVVEISLGVMDDMAQVNSIAFTYIMPAAAALCAYQITLSSLSTIHPPTHTHDRQTVCMSICMLSEEVCFMYHVSLLKDRCKKYFLVPRRRLLSLQDYTKTTKPIFLKPSAMEEHIQCLVSAKQGCCFKSRYDFSIEHFHMFPSEYHHGP